LRIVFNSFPFNPKIKNMFSLSVLLTCMGLVAGTTYFKETFDTDPFADNRWVVSKWKQDTNEAGEWEWSPGLWTAHSDRKGLRTTQDARFYAISSQLAKPFDNSGNTLVFQFKVKHEQKIDCGGGYVKLLPPGVDAENLNGETSYTIMFGPDICGYSTKKVHTIFHHNGENLLKTSDVTAPDDELTHTYTLIVNSDDTYEIRVDGEKKDSGKLKEGWDFEKPKTIPDPKAKKPSDWVDEEMMDDSHDIKPSDWDNELEKIADPDATKPADWDDEEDGQWEAPLIDNPKYKGEWKPKQIKNPDYKGPWVHPEISNPDYVEQKDVYKRGPIGYVSIEVWQVKSGTLFSDFILTDSVSEVEQFSEERSVKKDDEENAKKIFDEAHKAKEEEEPTVGGDFEDETHDEL
jgi:calreticulin